MAYDFKNVSVLVVESSKPMFKLVKDVLNIFGVPGNNIYEAYSPDEAFQSFREFKHDLVIADWLQNPDRGIELTRTIRMNQATPNPYVPIIMTAGSGHLSRVLRARDAGISEYLVKPFSAQALADRISRVIEKPRKFIVSANYVGPERRIKNVPFDGMERRVNKPEEAKK
jgi:DNA-binding response OmpR family regulator